MAGKNTNAKIWHDAVSPTSDCPGPQGLEKMLEGRVEDRKTQEHVGSCPYCQSELRLLRSFVSAQASPEEGAAVAWITAQLERNQNRPTAKTATISFWRSMFRVPYLAAAAALVVAVTLGVSVYISEDVQKPSINESIGISGPLRSGQIRLTSPMGDVSKLPEDLSWEHVAGAVRYSVLITAVDIDSSLIWQGQSAGNNLPVGPELKSKIRPGKPLAWKVIALDASGRELAIGEGRFRLAVAQNPQH